MDLNPDGQNSRCKSLLELTNDWIWEVNEQFQITYTSKNIQTFLGYSPQEAIGKSLFEFMPDKEGARAKKMFEHHSGQRLNGHEFTFSDKNNNKIFVKTSGVPLYNSDESYCGYRGVGKDITPEKLSEIKIARLNNELERKVKERTKILKIANQELEAFSYSVSHDLRTPLRSIDGFSQALIEDYGDTLDETGKNYLSRVRSNAQKMSALIDDIIKLAKVSRTSISENQVNLSAVVKSVAELVKQNDPERKVDFVIEKNMVAKADKTLIKIVYQNLIENAWKFTAKQPDARIEIGSDTHKGEKTYYVKDNGAGFNMEYAHKLFTPFQRLHKESDYPGTGIGLATVQRIIHRHMGNIRGEGKVGKGAAFYFTLNSKVNS